MPNFFLKLTFIFNNFEEIQKFKKGNQFFGNKIFSAH